MLSLLVRTSAVEFTSRSRGSSHRSYWRPAGQQQIIMKKSFFFHFWYSSISNRWLKKQLHPLFSFTGLGLNTVSKATSVLQQWLLQETSCTPQWRSQIVCAGESATCVALKQRMCSVSRFFFQKSDSSQKCVIGLVWVLRITYLTKRGVHFVIENPTSSLLWRYRCVRVSQLMLYNCCTSDCAATQICHDLCPQIVKISGIDGWPW